MARSSTTSDNKQFRNGKCIDCAKGYVMDDGVKGNPLIIECTVTHIRYPQGWISGDGCFSPRDGQLEIHPMTFVRQRQKDLSEVL